MEGPSQALTLVDIRIDATTSTLSLSHNKSHSFMTLLRHFATLHRVSLKQLQMLAGKLALASNVVQRCRTYLQRVYDTMQSLRHRWHKVKLSSDFNADIARWIRYMDIFNEVSFNYTRPHVNFLLSDASLTGSGAVFNFDDWLCVG